MKPTMETCAHRETLNCDMCEATGALEAKLEAEVSETKCEECGWDGRFPGWCIGRKTFHRPTVRVDLGPKPITFTKEWCMTAARSEGDSDPTTGNPTPALERMTPNALSEMQALIAESRKQSLTLAEVSETKCNHGRTKRFADVMVSGQVRHGEECVACGEDVKPEPTPAVERMTEKTLPELPWKVHRVHEPGPNECPFTIMGGRLSTGMVVVPVPTEDLARRIVDAVNAQMNPRGDGCWHGDKGHPCALDERDAARAREAALQAEVAALKVERDDWENMCGDNAHRANKAEADRDRLRERLDQFDAYAITVDSALKDRGEVDRLRAALEKLASMEAMTVAQSVDLKHPNGLELQARVRFAQEAVAAQPQGALLGLTGDRRSTMKTTRPETVTKK